jgi:hypothetical protein
MRVTWSGNWGSCGGAGISATSRSPEASTAFTDPTGRSESSEDAINRIKGDIAGLRARNRGGVFNDTIKLLEKRIEELAKINKDQWHNIKGSQ